MYLLTLTAKAGFRYYSRHLLMFRVYEDGFCCLGAFLPLSFSAAFPLPFRRRRGRYWSYK
jgi:hypothetical protein